MSTVDALTDAQIDSKVDRAALRTEVAALKEIVTEHREAIEGLKQHRTQVLTIVAVALLLGTAGFLSLRWTVKHAVVDALVEYKVIEMRRAP